MPSNDNLALPTEIVRRLVEQVYDAAGIKVVLAVAELTMSDAQGLVRESALLEYQPLVSGLRSDGQVRPPVEEIQRGIDIGLATDCLLRISTEDDAPEASWIMLASQENRFRIDDLVLYLEAEDLIAGESDHQGHYRLQRPNIFGLYEQNIGIVTPIIADKLVEAVQLYPTPWIEDAITESVTYNRRSWRYIQRILENWATEGRGNETDRRHQRTQGSFDPGRHIRGKRSSTS